MSELWLILDCPFLAHRAEAVVGGLSHGRDRTSVVFSLMRDLIAWRETFRTDRVAFCFDSRTSLRRQIYQRYKESRRKEPKDLEEKESREALREQVARLRDEDLYRIGYRNVFWEEGYEADDAIASIVANLPEGSEAVIVANDSDLLQLIGPRVSMFDPRTNRRKTLQWFSQRYGISPPQWADVKAIAGCDGDDVRGISGVGEKTAIAFLTGKLKEGTKRREAIVSGNRVWERNLRLVRLPFEGCPRFELREDVVSRERWDRFCGRFGIKSLRGLYPGR